VEKWEGQNRSSREEVKILLGTVMGNPNVNLDKIIARHQFREEENLTSREVGVDDVPNVGFIDENISHGKVGGKNANTGLNQVQGGESHFVSVLLVLRPRTKNCRA